MLGLKEPEPPDQTPDDVPPDTVPERTVITLFLQVVKSKPAFTNGEGVKLILTLSTDWLQLPLFVEVKVKVMTPAARSAALGIYVAFNVVLFGEYVPVPPAHIPVVVGPETIPERMLVGLF